MFIVLMSARTKDLKSQKKKKKKKKREKHGKEKKEKSRMDQRVPNRKEKTRLGARARRRLCVHQLVWSNHVGATRFPQVVFRRPFLLEGGPVDSFVLLLFTFIWRFSQAGCSFYFYSQSIPLYPEVYRIKWNLLSFRVGNKRSHKRIKLGPPNKDNDRDSMLGIWQTSIDRNLFLVASGQTLFLFLAERLDLWPTANI